MFMNTKKQKKKKGIRTLFLEIRFKKLDKAGCSSNIVLLLITHEHL